MIDGLKSSRNTATFTKVWNFMNSCPPPSPIRIKLGMTSSTTPDSTVIGIYRVARKKRPELLHGIMQRSRWNKSAEKHVCNEQTSSNMSMNFHQKRLHISRDTSEIVLHVIKQCLQTVRHLCCWLYAGYQNVTVIRIRQLISRKCAE